MATPPPGPPGAEAYAAEEARKGKADTWARVTAVLVLAVGLVVVVAPAVLDIADVFDGNAFEPRNTTTRVTKVDAQGRESTETTEEEADDSFLERSLADGGLLLLRLGLIALAAFLAGAVVQRTLLGEFAVKAGPIELPARETAAISAKAIGDIQTGLDAQRKAGLMP